MPTEVDVDMCGFVTPVSFHSVIISFISLFAVRCERVNRVDWRLDLLFSYLVDLFIYMKIFLNKLLFVPIHQKDLTDFDAYIEAGNYE